MKPRVLRVADPPGARRALLQVPFGPYEVAQGRLRLDSREALLRGGGNGPAIVPGKPDDSLLFKALSHDGDVAEMPPDEKLPDRVLADFRRWIASGAPDPRKESPAVTTPAGGDVASGRDSWAFRPPRHHVAPSVRDTSWARDELDRFILAGLEAKELRPAPDADRYTWLRRVALDLIGLPPSPEQIVAFINDSSPWARERVVDRLLASPAFGERWARHWLDLTGYADQIGTANDIFAEHAWRYRDYVIAAFNADRPFDRFIREQLAGDLLPYDTVEERARNLIATGFLVLGDLTVVEADKAKLRVDVIDQQVDKVGKAFLGMTIACARCHDHKFDPDPAARLLRAGGNLLEHRVGLQGRVGRVELADGHQAAGNSGGTGRAKSQARAASESHRGRSAAERERAGHRSRGDRRDPPGQGQKDRGQARSTRPQREALEKERRELRGPRRQARHGDRACRVLRPGRAGRLRRARFRQTRRHADHDPGQRPRAGRPGPPRVRAGRPRGIRVGGGDRVAAAEKFAKMIAFLRSPACRRVRTNNHVERVNRKLRYEEKARYKWRKRRTMMRFVVLLLDRYWRQERRARSRWQEEVQPEPHQRSSPKAKPVKRVA